MMRNSAFKATASARACRKAAWLTSEKSVAWTMENLGMRFFPLVSRHHRAAGRRKQPLSLWSERACGIAMPTSDAGLSAFSLVDRHPAQKLDRFAHAFHGRHHHVLVLDGQHVVIARLLEGGAELAPPRLAMAVAERDVVPAPLGDAVAGA